MRIKVTGLDEIINYLEDYEKSLKEKTKTFMERLAAIGIDIATVRFMQAEYDGTNDVSVSQTPIWEGDNKLVVSATGRTVGFIEFGTGVHYTEVHPKAAEFGAIRGSFGYGLGKRDSWRYKGDPGTHGEVITEGKHVGEIKTHGNPPARAMYEAAKEMRNKIREIAKEVYGSD